MNWLWFGRIDMGRKFTQWEATCVSASWVAICLASGSKSMPHDNRSTTHQQQRWQLFEWFLQRMGSRRNFSSSSNVSSLLKLVWYAGTCRTLCPCGLWWTSRNLWQCQVSGGKSAREPCSICTWLCVHTGSTENSSGTSLACTIYG